MATESLEDNLFSYKKKNRAIMAPTTESATATEIVIFLVRRAAAMCGFSDDLLVMVAGECSTVF